MERSIDWVLIGKYISGECSDKERGLIDKDPELRELVSSLTLFIAGTVPSPTDREIRKIDDLESLKKVHEAIMHMDAATVGGAGALFSEAKFFGKDRRALTRYRDTGRDREKDVRPILKIAAVFVVITGLVYAGFNLKMSQKTRRPSLRASNEFSTGRGGRKRLLLSDGTEIMLNSVSKITVSKTFGKESRTVRLQGEAFFDVAHLKKPPFIVETSNGTIQDLGTEFNVKAWPGSGETQVAVTKGDVTLRAGDSSKRASVSITAGEVSVSGKNGILVGPVKRNLNQYLAWISGGMVFDRTPFKEVLVDLGRQFPATFVVSDSSLLSKRVTATLARQPLRAILTAISVSLDLRCVNRGDTILFERKKGNSLKVPLKVQME